MATAEQTQAANNLKEIANYNIETATNQLGQINQNYDASDTQNRALADKQLKQNSQQTANDRFGANKKLQTAVQGLANTAGNALRGSQTGRLLDMVRTRTDLDNNATWNMLRQNQNAVENAYTEAFNENVLARNDAASTAEQSVRGVNADTAAQLSNIAPDLYVKPGDIAAGNAAAATDIYNKNKKAPNITKMQPYWLPENAQYGVTGTTQIPNVVGGSNGNSYYSQLLNGYNNDRRY